MMITQPARAGPVLASGADLTRASELGAMVQSAVVDWSANLSRLHELIASGGPDRIPGESDEARVHRFLERLCRSLERQAPPRIRDRLQPDAILSLLLEKIPGFREGQGRFEAWCGVVVSHYAFDVCHRSRDTTLRNAL